MDFDLSYFKFDFTLNNDNRMMQRLGIVEMNSATIVAASLDVVKTFTGFGGEGKRIKYSFLGSGSFIIRVPVYATDWKFIEDKYPTKGRVSKVLLLPQDDRDQGSEVNNPGDLNDNDTIYIEFS